MSIHKYIYTTLAVLISVFIFAQNSFASPAFLNAPVIKSEKLNEFPHDINAFTQGFIIHNNFFYESTGKHGKSSLRKIETSTGIVRTETRIDNNYFGEGLCLWKGQFYQLTWQDGKCFVYDSKSLARKGLFKYAGQGWGLTTDGDFLYQSDGSDTITLRDPYDFARISKLKVKDGDRKIRRLNELEYIDGFIYCNIWKEDLIAAVDPADGKVMLWLDISNLRPLAGPEAEAANGIAFDTESRRLFVTGKLWNKVFEIKLPAIERNFTRNIYE